MATKAQINVKIGALTEGFDKGMKRIEKKLKKTGRLLKKTGSEMTQNFSAPIAAIGVLSVKVFADFEQGMLKVKAISGATITEMDTLTKTAKKLGSETMFTATQVSELQLSLSKLGLTPKEINKSTGAILNLAQATDSDLAQSATIAASTMRAFGLESEDMNRIVDVMADAISSSALDMSKFETAMSSVAPVARVAGASLEQTTSILGVLTNNGIEASTAGTALRNIFLDLAKNGMSWEEAMTSIQNATDPLARSFELFGKRGANVATIISENGVEIQKLTADLIDSEGEAKRMANIMDSGLSGSLRKLKSATEGAGIEIGQGLKPVIESLARTLQNVALFFRDLSGGQKQFIITIALVVGAIGPLLIIFGKLTLGLASVSKAFIYLNKKIVAHPYIAAAVAIGLLAAALYKAFTAGKKLSHSQIMLNRISAEGVYQTMESTKAIKENLKIARNSKLSDEERKDATRFLKREISSLNGELKLSEINTKRVTNAVNEHTQSMIAQAQKQGAIEKMAELQKQMFDLEQFVPDPSVFDEATATMGNFMMWVQGYGDMISDDDGADFERFMNNKEIKKVAVEIQALTKYMNSLDGSIKTSSTTFSMARVENTKYNDTIEGMNQKLSDLTNVFENSEKGSKDYISSQKAIKNISKELAKEYDKLAVKSGGSGNGSVASSMSILNAEIQELTKQFYNAELAGEETGDILTLLKAKTKEQKDAQDKLNKSLATESDLLKEGNKLITERVNIKTGRREQITYGSQSEMDSDTSGTGGSVTGIFNEFTNEFESLDPVIDSFFGNITNKMQDFGHNWLNSWKSTIDGVIAVVSQLDQTFDAFFKMKTQRINNDNKEQENAIDDEHKRRVDQLSNISDEEKRAEALAQLDKETAIAREELEEQTQIKLNKIKRQQAIKDKALGIFQATINGISAVVSALKFGPVYALMVGALVAAQVGMLAATPIPKFADGGIVSGPTLGIMGEYSNAKSNPEVIAPLDKLQSLMSGTTQNVIVTGKLIGNDIFLSNSNAGSNRKRTT